MDDKIEINITYSRSEILGWAEKMKGMGGTLTQVNSFLDDVFPAWRCDTRATLTVQLMFRGEDDMFHEFLTERLDALNKAERLAMLANEYRL